MNSPEFLISCMPFIFGALGFLCLWLGSKIAVWEYRDEIKSGNSNPEPWAYGLAFSVGATLALLAACSAGLNEENVAFLESRFLSLLFGVLLLSALLTMTGEWLLRKMARHYESNVPFEPWLILG